MSIEETNGFSVPNEDANVAGADSNESAPADQTAHTPENNETAPGSDDAAQASSESTPAQDTKDSTNGSLSAEEIERRRVERRKARRRSGKKR